MHRGPSHPTSSCLSLRAVGSYPACIRVRTRGPLLINPIIYAEFASGYPSIESAELALAALAMSVTG